MKKILIILLFPIISHSQTISGRSLMKSDWDADALTYLNAAGITTGQTYYGIASEQIMTAYNTLIKSLKSNNLYQKIKYFYPFSGTTNAQNFVNMIKPGTKDMTSVTSFAASWSKEGYVGDGTTILSTGILLSEFLQDSMTAGWYTKTLTGVGHDFGTVAGANAFYVGHNTGNTSHYRSAVFVNITPVPISNCFSIMTCTGINIGATYTNGSLNTSVTSTEDSQNSAYNSYPVYFSGYNNIGVASGASNSTYSCFFMMSAVSSTEASTLNTIISQWITDMGR